MSGVVHPSASASALLHHVRTGRARSRAELVALTGAARNTVSAPTGVRRRRPEGVRQPAAEGMKTTARAAPALGVDVVVGFTGSKIGETVAMVPPVPESMIDDGYADFADRCGN